jgi:hypothetical protein
VPVAVIGPRPAVPRLAAGLQRVRAFRVIESPTESSAVALVQRRKADAIINLDTHQLQTAQVASTLTPVVLEQIFSSPTSTLHPNGLRHQALRPGGFHAARSVFITLAQVLGGIPAGVAFTLLGKRGRVTSLADAAIRTAVMAFYSILQGPAVALIAGDLILGYGGHALLSFGAGARYWGQPAWRQPSRASRLRSPWSRDQRTSDPRLRHARRTRARPVELAAGPVPRSRAVRSVRRDRKQAAQRDLLPGRLTGTERRSSGVLGDRAPYRPRGTGLCGAASRTVNREDRRRPAPGDWVTPTTSAELEVARSTLSPTPESADRSFLMAERSDRIVPRGPSFPRA